MPFTHLHAHTWFSFGTGASSPDAMATAAAQHGDLSLAMTDINGVYGAIEFQRACISAGVRPIMGAHLVTSQHHATVLAEDERGWAAICRACTEIHWSNEHVGRPQAAGVRSSEPHALGSIVEACPERCRRGTETVLHPTREGSENGAPAPRRRRAANDPSTFNLIAQLATDRDGITVLSSDIALLEQLVMRSGTAGIVAELKPGTERHKVLATARRLKIPYAITNGAVAAHAEDWNRHRLLRAIHDNTTLAQVTNIAPRDAWLRPLRDLERHFPDVPEAFDTTRDIAERCQYTIPMGRTIAPRIASGDAIAQLRALAYDGARRRYGTIARITEERLEHELEIIALKNFADYFLVVHDMVHHGPTHCGRGSVANSIVSYCLGITHVEPLGAGLLFERFLNPARKDPPDIDLDFPWDERDHMLSWVFRKYPRPRAAMVANHNCLRMAGALREVAKVHGRPAAEIREVTRRIPHYEEGTVRDVMANHPNYRELKLPSVWGDLAAIAETIVGTPRHLSLHPGGVVIVPGSLTDVVPLEPAVKQLDGAPDVTVPVIQFEKDGAEDAGLVKIDLLGNRSLAVIRDAIASVKINTGIQLDYTSQEAGLDPATQDLFARGDTMGVFYTESPASRQLCLKSKARTYDLLVLNTSIIRPASNKWINIYLERLHGAPYQPLHPCLSDVLAETFGIMVYQEDVVNVAHFYAGLTWSEADGLRKSLSKKRPGPALASYLQQFVNGARSLGREDAITEQVWEMILSFSGYSFCKGHSCSYIQVAQQSCYLRAHYPAEFIAAVLANGGGFYHPFAYVAEARRMGVSIASPDVNASEWRCTGKGREMRVGLQFVKGLSAAGTEQLLAARERGGSFRDLDDLRARTGLSNDDVRLLIKVGACDTIGNGLSRPQLLWTVDTSSRARDRDPSTSPTLRAGFAQDDTPIPTLRDYSVERKREDAWALLSFCLDAHPMTLHAESLKRFRLTTSTALHTHVGKNVLMAGMYTTGKPVHTAKDEPMQFATFDDGHGLVECVLFPNVYRERSHVLFDAGPFLFRGKVEESFGSVTVTITHIERLERMLARMGKAKTGP